MDSEQGQFSLYAPEGISYLSTTLHVWRIFSLDETLLNRKWKWGTDVYTTSFQMYCNETMTKSFTLLRLVTHRIAHQVTVTGIKVTS